MSAATETATRYEGTFGGRPDQVRRGREEVAAHLAGFPARDDAVLIASELLSNAVLHSRSGRGGSLILRCERHACHVVIEVEDQGGPWRDRPHDGRAHGLDIVEALAGLGNWGVRRTGGGTRITWARLGLVAGTACPLPHCPGAPGCGHREATGDR